MTSFATFQMTTFQMTRHAALGALLFFAGTAFVVPALAQVTEVEPTVEEVMEEPMEPSAEPTAEPSAELGGEVTTVTEPCPKGTTAQPDGTCMMDEGMMDDGMMDDGMMDEGMTETEMETEAPAPETDPS